MKRLRVLLVLVVVLVVASVVPTYETNKGYYLYPTINYVGDITNLPTGETVEWDFGCTIFFKGVKIEEVTPISSVVLDKDRHTARSFTLSEIFNINIVYYVRIYIHLCTVYLWNVELVVDE